METTYRVLFLIGIEQKRDAGAYCFITGMRLPLDVIRHRF